MTRRPPERATPSSERIPSVVAPSVGPMGGVLADLGFDETGMPSPAAAPTLAEARGYLRKLATGHYENFSVLTKLVPERLRDDFAAVYGFCRWSDDLADEVGRTDESREQALRLLAWWRAELDSCFRHARGESVDAPKHPVYVALSRTIQTRELRPEPFHHLLDAFVQDQSVTRYQTWDQVVAYCRGSADPVGRIVLALAGHNGERPGDAERIAMSDATCTALQLTNHWQDVRRDLLERDRVYLPSEETGLDAAALRDMLDRDDDSAARVRYIRAVRPLVERTRALFRTGRPLARTLDREMRPVVWLFGAGGEAVLGRIRRIGCATLWERPSLPASTKFRLLATAAARTSPARLRR